MHVTRKITLLLGMLFLAACTALPAPTPVAPTATVPFTVTPLPPTPTATVTPPPPTAVLMGVAGSYPEGSAAVRSWVQALAQKQGYALVAVPPGKPLPPHTVVAVGVGVVPPVAEGARRLVVAPPEQADLEGVQVLDPATASGPMRAFLAGYIGVLITKDWRAGLLAEEDEQGLAAAFEDGGRYFCGLCRPLHPPFLVYPQYAVAPTGAQGEMWQAAVTRLVQSGVRTMVLSPAALVASMDDALDIGQWPLIALAAPPADRREHFVAAIEPDVAAGLDALWQDPALQRTGVPLRVEVFDATLLTPGRQARVKEVQALLQEGLIQP